PDRRGGANRIRVSEPPWYRRVSLQAPSIRATSSAVGPGRKTYSRSPGTAAGFAAAGGGAAALAAGGVAGVCLHAGNTSPAAIAATASSLTGRRFTPAD